MSKLLVFENVSLDGYFVDRHGDMRWAHTRDPEFDAFTAENARGGAGGVALYGRVTYEMMASFWPTPQAFAAMPDVARGMEAMEKVVLSRTLREVTWKNSRVLRDDPAAEARRLKDAGKDVVVMGSGSVVAQLAGRGLVDEYQLVVAPLVLGAGRTLFEGLDRPVPLRLLGTRTFQNGKVLLRYAEASAT